jgi:hypothetical protein
VRYDVTAIGVDPETAAVIAGPRTERIDTEVNELFADCDGPWDVEDRYEAFWNRLNDSWESNFPAGKEKVKVVRVDLVES